MFAISGELPFGTLAAPGAGMMPKLAAGLMMLFAALLMLAPAGVRAAAIDWRDRNHALLVIVITAIAVALYRPLGFLLAMTALVFALLVIVERRNVILAAAYAAGLTLFAYWLFGKALKSPLERGVLWF